jgi:hypothetical protein
MRLIDEMHEHPNAEIINNMRAAIPEKPTPPARPDRPSPGPPPTTKPGAPTPTPPIDTPPGRPAPKP